MSSDPVLAHCEAMIRRGSHTFARAAKLLPAKARDGAYLLYAWCRHCDDVIDGQTLGSSGSPPKPDVAQSRLTLAALRDDTARGIAGENGSHPVFVAVGRLVEHYGLPPDLPRMFLDAMAMDVDQRVYRTIDDVIDYCDHAGGSVGMMTAHAVSAADPPTLALTRQLGIAFQLTNIARDVIDDAARDRLYLPHDWAVEAGVPPAEITAPRNRAALFRVVARLLDRADASYRAARGRIAELPFRTAWAVATGSGMYAEIGRLVRRRGAKAWDTRAVVSSTRKTYWIGRGLLRAALGV